MNFVEVSTTHDGDYDVRVIAHVPKVRRNGLSDENNFLEHHVYGKLVNVFIKKVFEGKENQPCLIYAHGGGVVALNADM